MPTDAVLAELRDRWQQTLPGQTELGEQLISRYGEPRRHYHNADHLLSVLTWIDRLAGSDHDLFLVRLAAWFHDAIYDIPPGQLTNEEASARLAVRRLQPAGLETEDVNQVARLVRLTATHHVGPGDPNGELLCDADLAILAAPEDEYRAYVAAVREEYAEVDDARFWAGRLDVLERLAAGPLFRTGKGRKLLAAARANLDRECSELRAQLGLPEHERD